MRTKINPDLTYLILLKGIPKTFILLHLTPENDLITQRILLSTCISQVFLLL